MSSRIVEEKVFFPSGRLTLSGILSYPEETKPERGVLLCSPHPHFAGNMDNNVILGLAQVLSLQSVVFRFDYRGVGSSGIELPTSVSIYDYWTEVEEKKEYGDALADVEAAHIFLSEVASNLPLSLIGYSFGSVIGSLYGCKRKDIHSIVAISFPFTRMDSSFLQESENPLLILSGSQDFVFSPEEANKLRNLGNNNLIVRILENQDHFFRKSVEFLFLYLNPFLQNHRVPMHESN